MIIERYKGYLIELSGKSYFTAYKKGCFLEAKNIAALKTKIDEL